MLSKLQEKTNLVIKYLKKSFVGKMASITNLAASTRTLVEAEDHVLNSREEASKLIDHFKKSISTHLERVENTLKAGDPIVLSKTREKLGEGLLQGILGRDWNVLPSIYKEMDPLSMSDAILVQDDHLQHAEDHVTEIEYRLKNIESNE